MKMADQKAQTAIAGLEIQDLENDGEKWKGWKNGKW